MNIAKLNIHGQISIPAKLRKSLGLSVGDFVCLEEAADGGLLLYPAKIEKMSWEILQNKYAAKGVDMTLLWENLKRTPTERLEHHQEMLALVDEARRARAKQHG